MVVSFLVGCKEESAYQSDALMGHWEVYDAERNGKGTTLLNGAVFLFEEENKMQTNVTGQETSGMYQLEQNVIVFTSAEQMEFKIAMLHGDSLALTTNIQNMNFILRLKRATTK
jgi:hypothetical protein